MSVLLLRHKILAALFLAAATAGANAQSFSSQVRKLIAVDNDSFAIVHVTLIDGTGSPAKKDQTVIVGKGKILAVGDGAKTSVPAGIRSIDGSGKTVIPGMIMMHEHLFYGEYVPPNYFGLEMPGSFPLLYLAGGVTTMRTTGSVEPQTDLNLKEQITAGTIAGPDIDVTGPYIERAGIPIPEMLFIKSPADAAKEVNYWADMGCTSFKLYMDLTREDAKAAINAAHKRGLKVTGHLCSITFREAADLGIDDLEHGFFVSSDFDKNKKPDLCSEGGQIFSVRDLPVESPDMKELMAYLVKKNVALTSTLPVFEPETRREIFPGDAAEALTPPVREKVEQYYHSAEGKDSLSWLLFKKEMAWEKMFVDMGGKLLAGIDPTGSGRVIPGYADRHVPELLTEAGFSVEQAIRICSMNAAEYLGRADQVGSIQKGKRADLVLISGDITTDIHAMRKTEIVFKNGIGFDSAKMFAQAKGIVGLR